MTDRWWERVSNEAGQLQYLHEPDPSPETVARARELVTLAEQRLGLLEGRLLSERYLEGLTIREMARRGGVTPHAVRYRLRLAVRRLRALLELPSVDPYEATQQADASHEDQLVAYTVLTRRSQTAAARQLYRSQGYVAYRLGRVAERLPAAARLMLDLFGRERVLYAPGPDAWPGETPSR